MIQQVVFFKSQTTNHGRVGRLLERPPRARIVQVRNKKRLLEQLLKQLFEQLFARLFEQLFDHVFEQLFEKMFDQLFESLFGMLFGLLFMFKGAWIMI